METKMFPELKTALLLANLNAEGNLENRAGGNFDVFFTPPKFPSFDREMPDPREGF